MSDSESSESAPRPKPWRALVSAVLLFFVLVLATAALKGYRDLRATRDRERALATDVAATEARISALKRKIDRLRTDPVALDRAAREELGLVRPDEVVIVLPAPPAKTPPPAPSAPH